jgi:hypothetical protein
VGIFSAAAEKGLRRVVVVAYGSSTSTEEPAMGKRNDAETSF